MSWEKCSRKSKIFYWKIISFNQNIFNISDHQNCKIVNSSHMWYLPKSTFVNWIEMCGDDIVIWFPFIVTSLCCDGTDGTNYNTLITWNHSGVLKGYLNHVKSHLGPSKSFPFLGLDFGLGFGLGLVNLPIGIENNVIITDESGGVLWERNSLLSEGRTEPNWTDI